MKKFYLLNVIKGPPAQFRVSVVENDTSYIAYVNPQESASTFDTVEELLTVLEPLIRFEDSK